MATKREANLWLESLSSSCDKASKYRFRLKAGNGQVIATGEAYETKASALNGIESVRKNAAGATLDDQTD